MILKKIPDEEIEKILKEVVQEINEECTKDENLKSNYDWKNKIHVRREIK